MTMPDEKAGSSPSEDHSDLRGEHVTEDDSVLSGDVVPEPVVLPDGVTPPPLPRAPERAERSRTDPPAKGVVRRLSKSVGIALPRNRYRVFLGRGAIPPVSEVKQFVAPLAEINKVRIRILEGDDDQSDRNDFLGEIGINNIRLREDGKAELEIEFSLNATGILSIRLSDRIGDAEGMARYVLTQFRKETQAEADITNLPVEELSRKIDLLEQQMQLLKGELEVRGDRQ
jgi:molecular chaperone DnaK (HSP70)